MNHHVHCLHVCRAIALLDFFRHTFINLRFFKRYRLSYSHNNDMLTVHIKLGNYGSLQWRNSKNLHPLYACIFRAFHNVGAPAEIEFGAL